MAELYEESKNLIFHKTSKIKSMTIFIQLELLLDADRIWQSIYTLYINKELSKSLIS